MSAGSLAIDVTASTASLQAAMTQGANVTDREMKRVQRAVEYATTVLKAMEKAQRTANGAAADQARTSQVAERVADQARKAGISVGQMNSALRNTPAQISDIATQLAGGQSPFLVMTQQGLQMRDMFGGFGGMFRGLSTMISPVGLALGGLAAAGGAVAFAFTEASKVTDSYNRTMAMTGGYAGITTTTLQVMSEQVAKSSAISVSSAREIGQALMQTGRVGPDAMQGMMLGIAKLQAVTGESTDSVIKDFVRMREGVAKWAEEHNKQYHFLTVSQYEQIRATEKAGEVNKAMDLTLEALNLRLQANEGFWASAANSASNFFDRMLGRGSSELLTQLDEARAKLKSMQEMRGTSTAIFGGLLGPSPKSGPEVNQEQIVARLEEQMLREEAAKRTMAARQAYDEERIRASAKAADEQEKRNKEAEARAAQLREREAERLMSANKSSMQQMKERQIQEETKLKNLKETGKAYDDSTEAAKRLELAEGALKGSSKADAEGQLAQARITDAAIRARVAEEQRMQQVKEATAAQDAYVKSKAQHTLTIDREIAQMQAEADMVGRTTQEREIATAALKVHAQAQEMATKYADKAGEAAAWEAEQVAKVTAAIERRNALKNDPQTGVQNAVTKYMEDAANMAKYAENVVAGGLSRMEDALIGLVHTGKLSFGSLWQFMADEFIRQQLRMLVSDQLKGTGGLAGLLGGLFGTPSSVSTKPGSSVLVSDTPQLSTGYEYAATGYDYVPRDNTPFMLHEGEGVLTRAENAAMRSGGTGQVHVVNHIGQGVNRAEVTAAIYQAMAAVEARILSSKAHRGRFA
jgi:lambda family phage tail tape measure protein